MRISIGYASLDDPRGFPQQSANRQFQFFHRKAAIYPYIMGMAATLLKQAGHEVMWSDGPAEGLTWEQQKQELVKFQPDLIAWEVKTPSVIGTWERVDELKKAIPSCTMVLMGDHITALPQESLKNSSTDIALTGGDYDFGLMEVIADIQKKIIGKESRIPAVTGFPSNPIKVEFNFDTKTDLKYLPVVDRKLTKWYLYGYENGSGNYKYLPGTHSMIGRDCWWRHQGGCTFCSWTNTFKNWRVGTVDQFMAEIENCASLGIREVFDDTGTFPIGDWLAQCCKALTKFNQGKRHGRCPVTVGCNMRPGALTQDQYNAMGSAGFRFILYGLESANQKTLEWINKGQQEGDMLSTVRMAKKAGLEPHATCMVGYPIESREDAIRTIEFTKMLFAKGYIDTLQATICIPYPGTKLYEMCLENDWLKYEPGDWFHWDMRKPVMKTEMSDEELLSLTRGIYTSFMTPRYIARKLCSVRTKDDLRFLWRGAKMLKGHLMDFSGVH